MVGDGKALGLGDGVLTLLNFRVVELLHLAAIDAHQMVVVLSFIELINGLATFKMAPAQNVSLLELGQNTVNRGQADIGAFLQQNAEDILGRHVPLRALLEYLQNFQPGQSGLESGAFEFGDIGHGDLGLASRQATLAGTAGTMV